MSQDQSQPASNGYSHPNPAHTTETDYSPPRGNPFPVVGIGASAGGLEAFTQLLRALPERTGMAFVLVQHLDPKHESLLPELLSTATHMPVRAVEDGVKVEPDHIYVIPPNTSMELTDGTLRLAGREPGLHLPIDIFFRSLADVQGSRAIGIVLSGNASDGSLGVRAIKAECGITFAQDESTAPFSGMPHNAIATGAIDFILSPGDIGAELGRIARHKFMVAPQPGNAETETLPEGDADLRRILASLQTATKVNFAQYKPTTIRRRIGRRMMLLRIEALAEYARYVQQKPSELSELYKDVLISVTSFFRDPASFDALLHHLPGVLSARAETDSPIRVWVPGCATGEEVYSLAICLTEFLQERQTPIQIQLFGTDISEPALERARHGMYGPIIEDDVSERRLRRFFTKTEGGYQINKVIREACIFARHDVTRDPPFSRVDVVSCRNVLIYLDTQAQRRVLPTFHYSLNPNGLLMLGSAETTGAASDLFTPVDKPHRIYSRKAVPARLVLDLSSHLNGPVPAAHKSEPSPPAFDLHKKLDRLLQSKYSPDAVVVDSQMQILQFRGRTAPYIDPSPGEASLNLLRMARESIVLPLRRAVQRASEGENTVREKVSEVEIDGRIQDVVIEVTPISTNGPDGRCFFIVFARARELPPPPVAGIGESQQAPVDEQVAALKKELAETRDYLRQLTEQYEAHAEELRAANEEARSANEELQSTNEELGTTKEELQSSNEELTTVNEELQSRNQQLGTTNSDLRNLLSAVTVAILMVDDDLRVRRFNSSAEKLLDLTAVDVGRPLGHLRGRIETPRLEDQVRRVIDTLAPIAEEVQDRDGCWYSVAVRPYRTIDDRITGAVITFQEIDALKRGLQASEAARQYAEALIETVRQPLIVLDHDLRVQRATSAFYDTFMVAREETDGRFLYDIGNGQWNKPRLRELLGSALFRSEAFQDFEVEHDFPHIGRRTMRLSARRIPQPDSMPRTLLLAIDDVTERREISEIRYRRLFESAKDGIIVIDGENGAVQDVNKYFLELTGFERHDFIGKSIGDAGSMLGVADAPAIVGAAEKTEIVRRDDIEIKTRTGDLVAVDLVANRYLVGTHAVIQLNVRDVRLRKQNEGALRESEERFRLVVESVRDYAIFQLDSQGRVVTWNSGAERLLGWKEEEVIGMPGSIVFTREDIDAGVPERELAQARDEGSAEDERWHLRKDGTTFFAMGVVTMTRRRGEQVFTKVMRDMTSRKQQEDRLRQSLAEKSTLVREIHHRVKNNLQTIVSLLNLQASHTDDGRLIAAFEETQGRVRAIAQIHEQLYTSEDLRDVEVGAYLKGLAQELVTLHAASKGQVQLQVSVEALVLPIEKAIPIGLIANELIVNSLKHGLPERSGMIEVILERLPGDTGDKARLQVRDSGPGFPAAFEPSKPTSMGYRLIAMLLRQLRGRLEIGRGSGASVTIAFPLSPPGGGTAE